ncbi:MAG: YggS family pyridoxal phosphate-dependent enzyme [Haliea sp.]|uniref:YggS family pyridoxal phosphate-dependent enzyme n=1 Tax=Haliea sp. TaxID=1932666 RepID=UPI000C54D861|nr:YggS family pyridoxal phosphate-dependent enzyme [Haliea sp.]MBM68877.1 YggS family pyridoxal phosphate-dependent enzyme [Haliea sp.]|tara:strand:- start:74320 stop:75024 length:705 start_codon:yes stop_codon:yes gene_type:complete
MQTEHLAQRIARLLERVRLSAEKSQRAPEGIRVLAVSKTRDAEEVRAAAALGLRDFGENYVQEGLAKIEALAGLDLCWHFIGPIQSNKTRALAEHFAWVHSVDRLKIAQRLSAQRPAQLPDLQVCLQVNISGEDSKSGVDPSELLALATAVAQLPRLQLRGLMAIPAPADTLARQREPFARLRDALVALQATLPTLDTLSMGMSGDLEAAIAEGATIVRVGTDLFGPRATPRGG